MTLRFECEFFLSCLLVLFMNGVEYTALFLFAATVHEIGHFFALRVLKIKKAEFTLGLMGARIRADMKSLSYKKEFVVYISGALFNSFAALGTLLFLSERFDMRAMFFFLCNFSLALVNLLPVSNLDGGYALECLLLLFFDPCQSFFVMRWVSFFVTAVLSIISLFVALSLKNVTLLVFSSTLIFYLISGNPSCRRAS